MSIGLEVGEFCLEIDGCGSGLGGGLSDGLGWKKGPSSAFAGDGDRLPGMGSKPGPLSPLEVRIVSLMCDDTAEVSQESKPSSWDGLLDGASKEDLPD
jgi:hypothetical protein